MKNILCNKNLTSAKASLNAFLASGNTNVNVLGGAISGILYVIENCVPLNQSETACLKELGSAKASLNAFLASGNTNVNVLGGAISGILYVLEHCVSASAQNDSASRSAKFSNADGPEVSKPIFTTPNIIISVLVLANIFFILKWQKVF